MVVAHSLQSPHLLMVEEAEAVESQMLVDVAALLLGADNGSHPYM